MKNANSITTTGLCVWALRYASRRTAPLAVVVSTVVIKAGLDVLKPWPMVFLIDYVLRGKVMPPVLQSFTATLPGAPQPLHLAAWAIAATALLFLFGWTVNVITAYANVNLGQRLTYDLAADLFTRLQQLSLKFHGGRSVGDNVRRVTADCACISTIVKDALVPVFSSVVTLAAMFIVMWRINPLLTLTAMAVAPLMGLAFRLYAKPMMDRSYAQQEAEARIYEVVEQTFSAMPVVHAFSRETANDQRFQATTDDAMATTLAATNVQIRFKFLIGLSSAAGTAGILWIGTHYALRGELTVGAIVLFLSYLGSLYAPMEAIMYTSSTIQGASGSARRVLEVLESEPDVRDKPGALPLPPCRGDVTFENVTFGYESANPVLRSVSFTAHAGETIAIVGASGAGKSTLVSLIPRFADPWQGRVLVDNRDVREVTLKSLRQQIAVVLQEPFLFPLSVAENIAYGQPDATMDQILEAARNANAEQFIQRLPRKFDTVVGERGATFSGGERQRISIARAFLKNAPILILDEPTSALDTATEQSLLDALDRLTAGRTTFIIAHRLTTVRRATRIIILDHGSIVETGSHDELIAHDSVYARYYRLQFNAPVTPDPNRPLQPSVS
jgi:ATP-binding cassette subfamily B protein/subfamily B ATP-binding cassette protein MsbA